MKTGPLLPRVAAAFHRRLVRIAEEASADRTARRRLAEIAAQMSALLLQSAGWTEVAGELAARCSAKIASSSAPSAPKRSSDSSAPPRREHLRSGELLGGARVAPSASRRRRAAHASSLIDPSEPLEALVARRPDLAGLAVLTRRATQGTRRRARAEPPWRAVRRAALPRPAPRRHPPRGRARGARAARMVRHLRAARSVRSSERRRGGGRGAIDHRRRSGEGGDGFLSATITGTVSDLLLVRMHGRAQAYVGRRHGPKSDRRCVPPRGDGAGSRVAHSRADDLRAVGIAIRAAPRARAERARRVTARRSRGRAIERRRRGDHDHRSRPRHDPSRAPGRAPRSISKRKGRRSRRDRRARDRLLLGAGARPAHRAHHDDDDRRLAPRHRAGRRCTALRRLHLPHRAHRASARRADAGPRSASRSVARWRALSSPPISRCRRGSSIRT